MRAREPDLPTAPLPSNANWVAFAADAQSVLRRPWADVVRLVVRPSFAFHRQSGLPVLAGFSWRVGLDHHHRRVVQLVLGFCVDGPASSIHLEALEMAVLTVFPGAGAARIERRPPNPAHVVLAHEGRSAVPWTAPEGGGEPEVTALVSEGSRVSPRVVPRSRATPDLVPPELGGVLGVLAPMGDEEWRQERLRVAFALHYCDLVVRADGVVTEAESRFVSDVFPLDLVRRFGLDRPEARAEALRLALLELPGRLGHHDKLALVALLFSACNSDGALAVTEMKVLKDAGEALGLTKDQVVKYLRHIW